MFQLSVRRIGPLWYAVILLIALLLGIAQPSDIAAQGAQSTWRGEYYTNRYLSGQPLLVRNEENISFNWGYGSPTPGFPADEFSARWSGSVYFDSGRYAFFVEIDDGARLYIDGKLVIDAWRVGSVTRYSAEMDLTAGTHTVRMEYFEATGEAVARMWWKLIPGVLPSVPDWLGEYYGNKLLSGPPILARNDTAIDFNWGYGSPAPNVPSENFSVRWTRTLTFRAGTYEFATETDDGVRLFVDNALLINEWRDMAATKFSVHVDLLAGPHTIRMEYYDSGGEAVAKLKWRWLPDTIPSPPPTDSWRGEYFGNKDLFGPAVFVRNDRQIKFDWGAGSPDRQLAADNFSVRWSRKLSYKTGVYRFTVASDDGIRLYVDGNLIINEWRTMGRTEFTKEMMMRTGDHVITVEYFEQTGAASVSFAQSGPMELPSRGNIVTCVPPYPSYSWIKVYRLTGPNQWQDMNPSGWGTSNRNGRLKIDGLPVDYLTYGDRGHPYRVELWVDGKLSASTGDFYRGQAEWRLRADADNFTPWQCPANLPE